MLGGYLNRWLVSTGLGPILREAGATGTKGVLPNTHPTLGATGATGAVGVMPKPRLGIGISSMLLSARAYVCDHRCCFLFFVVGG